MSNVRPIGVFDSGMGGLTVVRALRTVLPREDIYYIGDTARLPYGTKSAQTIQKYALQISQKLLAHNIKTMVVACNSASANALTPLQKSYPELLITGVIDSGAKMAAELSDSGHILVLATEATEQSDAYRLAIQKYRPNAQVVVRGCPVLVALAEAGWTTGPIAEAAVAEYLSNQHPKLDTVLLGCTHFPLLTQTIQTYLSTNIKLIDSASAIAADLKTLLTNKNLLNPAGGALELFVTDGVDRFAQIGCRFLGTKIQPDAVRLLDL